MVTLVILLFLLLADQAFGAKTLAQFRNEARQLYTAASAVPDSEANTMINRAIQILAKATPLRDSVAIIVLSEGVREYSLPADFLAEFAVRDSSHGLKKISENNLGKSEEGVAGSYYLRFQTLGIDDLPVTDGDTIWVPYSKKPKALSTDTNTTDININYEDVIAYFVAADFALRDLDPNANAYLSKAIFETNLIQARLGLPPVDILSKPKVLEQ